MLSIGRRKISLLICCAIALHLFWALMIAMDYAALNSNALNSLLRVIHDPLGLIIILLFSSVIAIVGMIMEASWVILLFIPQQLVLTIAASGAVDSIWLGQFADGVLRPAAFIAADQVYAIILAVGHTIAIVAQALQGPR